MDSSLRFGAKIKKKISQSRKGAKGIGSLFASCPPRRTKRKKIVFGAGRSKKLTRAKPAECRPLTTLKLPLGFFAFFL
jgi:hypothetical protein